MMRVFRAELQKLNGSLALLLAVVAPGLPGALALLALVSADRTPSWNSMIDQFVLPIWAFFLLPMAVTAFTTLVAQIEYKGRSWDHVLALPIARWRIFTAKAILVLVAVLGMTALAILFTLAGAWLGGSIAGNMPLGAVPWQRIGRVIPMIATGAAFFVALQLWAALRFSNFVVPLAFGIGGTLVAIAVTMTRTDKADWFPWVLPVRIIMGADPTPYVLIGGIGGLVAFTAMVIDLGRRSLR